MSESSLFNDAALSPIPHLGNRTHGSAFMVNVSPSVLLEPTSSEEDKENPMEDSILIREKKQKELDDEIQKTQRELDASSQAFIERIRGAASRRRKDLARSRDSLVCKEREHRQALEAAKQNKRYSLGGTTNSTERQKITRSIRRKSVATFRALPLPESTGGKGTGGMVGVPRVRKRETTTPFSPMLGKRRPKTIASTSSKHKIKSPKSYHFRARPVPHSACQFGLYGVPKVEKRPTTVALSPKLGSRRTRRLSAPVSHRILGNEGKDVVAFHETPIIGSTIHAEKDPQVLPKPSFPHAFEPHSTRRAEERRVFEARRAANEQRRKEVERVKRRMQMKEINRQLDALRENL